MFSGVQTHLSDIDPQGKGRNSTVLETLGSGKGLIQMALFLLYIYIYFKFKVYNIMIVVQLTYIIK